MYGEQQMKEQAERLAYAQMNKCPPPLYRGETAEAIGRALDEPCQESLVSDIQGRLRRAERTVNEKYRLERLAALMDKHPEVTELLDLLGVRYA